MDWAHPYHSLVPSLHGDVLVTLLRLRRPVTGRELAEEVGASPEGVRQVIAALEEQGLVHRQRAGRAQMVELNREHVALPVIEALAALRSTVFERLRAAVAAWPTPRPESVVVFGSVARGDATVASDVDLLLVRPARIAGDDPAWIERTAALAHAITRWTGNRCEVVEYTVQELRAPRRSRSSFVKAVVAEGITIYGKPIQQLMGDAA